MVEEITLIIDYIIERLHENCGKWYPQHPDKRGKIWVWPFLLLILILRLDHSTRTKVKRVVITSSCSAIVGSPKTTVILNEENWGDEFVTVVPKEGEKVHPIFMYGVSKTLAEKGEYNSVRFSCKRYDMVGQLHGSYTTSTREKLAGT